MIVNDSLNLMFDFGEGDNEIVYVVRQVKLAGILSWEVTKIVCIVYMLVSVT